MIKIKQFTLYKFSNVENIRNKQLVSSGVILACESVLFVYFFVDNLTWLKVNATLNCGKTTKIFKLMFLLPTANFLG